MEFLIKVLYSSITDRIDWRDLRTLAPGVFGVGKSSRYQLMSVAIRTDVYPGYERGGQGRSVLNRDGNRSFLFRSGRVVLG